MEIKTTPGTRYDKPASHKSVSDDKKPQKTGTKVSEKTSLSSGKQEITEEHKYDRSGKTGDTEVKEQFFDDLSKLRTMSDKHTGKAEEQKEGGEKPQGDKQELDRKEVLDIIRAAPKESLKIAKSAIDKLNACGDELMKKLGKEPEQMDFKSAMFKASKEVPQNTKQLWDTLDKLKIGEADHIAKTGEEKVTEDKVKSSSEMGDTKIISTAYTTYTPPKTDKKKTEEKEGQETKKATEQKADQKEEKNWLTSMYDSALGTKEDPNARVNEDQKQKWLKDLKQKDPEKYKKYMCNEIDADQKISESKMQAWDTMKKGIDESKDFLEKVRPDNLLKSAITGTDVVEQKKADEEADKNLMQLAKDKKTNKSHVKDIVNSQGKIDKEKLGAAESTQKLADDIDGTITFGASGKLVDAEHAFVSGHYGEAAWDVGSAGVRVAGSALLWSGKAFKWAGQGLSKLGGAGTKILESVAPEVTRTIKAGAGAVGEVVEAGKGLVKDAVDGGKELLGKVVDSGEGVVSKVVDGGKELLGDAVETGKGIIDNAKETAKKVVDPVEDQFKKVWKQLNKEGFKPEAPEKTVDVKEGEKLLEDPMEHSKGIKKGVKPKGYEKYIEDKKGIKKEDIDKPFEAKKAETLKSIKEMFREGTEVLKNTENTVEKTAEKTISRGKEIGKETISLAENVVQDFQEKELNIGKDLDYLKELRLKAIQSGKTPII